MSSRTWDCHTHVFGPYDEYPLTENRSYTPPPASITDLRVHLDALGLDQVVLVQPHSYGTDTRAMMAALVAFGDRARAVTVIDPQTTTVDQLENLRRKGIRGVRVNVHTARSSVPVPALDRLLELLCAAHLHLQVFASGPQLAELVPRLTATAVSRGDRDAVPVVVDHMGMALHGGDHHEATKIVRVLCENGCWVKLSAPERMGVQPGDPRVRDLVDQFAARAPDRIVWGSDWPHSALAHTRPVEETEPFRAVDDGARLQLLESWLGADLYRRVMCDNPAVLYS